MAVTCNRYKFVAVSFPKRFRDGSFTSETATWIQKWFKEPLGLLESSTVDVTVFQGGDDGRGHHVGKCTKYFGGPP
jgi:hypothetical protein